MDRTINDSVFEALFRQAVIDNFNEELDSLPPDEELAKIYTFSPEHENRMRRLFTLEARKERTRTVIRWSRRAVAVIVIAVTIIFSTLMFVPQVRAAVAQTIIEWCDKFVRFTSRAPEEAKMDLAPGYIPDGFNEIIRDESDTITTVIYENEDDMLLIFQASVASGSLSVDNENSNYEMCLIDDIEYHIFTSTVEAEDSLVVWETKDQRYTISSMISIEEILAMATSIT